MNPLRSLSQHLIYFGVVTVASSNPPGRRPIFLPFFIKPPKFLWSTASTPHNLRIKPVIGKFKAKRLDRPTRLEIGPVLTTFISARRLSAKTL